MPRVARAACLCAIGVVVLAGCGGGEKHPSATRTATIAVDAPFSRDAYIGTTIENGVRLATAHLGVMHEELWKRVACANVALMLVGVYRHAVLLRKPRGFLHKNRAQ